MKTYCKDVDITNVEYISKAIEKYMSDKCRKPWAVDFYAYFSGNSKSYVKEHLHKGDSFLSDTTRMIAEEMSIHLKYGTVALHIINRSNDRPIIRYVVIKDKGSGKDRVLGLESTILRFYEYIAQYAAEPLFNAKVGEFQCASIKKKGQQYGKKAVKKWLSGDPVGTKYCCKADVQKCYPSIPHENLRKLLHRDLHKSPVLLNLYDTILDFYEQYPNPYSPYDYDRGILVGSPASKDLCNYYLSHLYHYASEKLAKVSKRRGKEKRVRLLSHIIIYMDDIVIYGSNKKDLHAAMGKLVTYAKDFLGLVIKPDWRKFLSSYTDKNGMSHGCDLDFMGFVFHGGHVKEKDYFGNKVKHKKVWVTIRTNIFLKSRKKLHKFSKKIKRKQKVSLKIARGIASQFGWFKNTNSFRHRCDHKVDKIVRIARAVISDYERNEPYNTEEYYEMLRWCHV